MTKARFIASPENAHDLATLRAYMDALPDGDEVMWQRIEADTRIQMDTRGKGLVRAALGKRPYESIRGAGLRLSSAEAVPRILHEKLRRIDGAVTRADKTQQVLQERHFHQMSTAGQQKMLLLSSFFGSIRAIARSAKAQYPDPPQLRGDREK